MGLFLPLIQTLPWEDCIKIEIFRFWHEPGRKRTWARGYCTETHRLGSSWAKWAKSPNFSLISPNTTFYTRAGHYPVTRGMLWACPGTSSVPSQKLCSPFSPRYNLFLTFIAHKPAIQFIPLPCTSLGPQQHLPHHYGRFRVPIPL